MPVRLVPAEHIIDLRAAMVASGEITQILGVVGNALVRQNCGQHPHARELLRPLHQMSGGKVIEYDHPRPIRRERRAKALKRLQMTLHAEPAQMERNQRCPVEIALFVINEKNHRFRGATFAFHAGRPKFPPRRTGKPFEARYCLASSGVCWVK